MLIREATFPDDLAAVRSLFQEYADGLGVDLCFQGFADELATLPGRYARPAGGVWLAVEGDRLAGCVALRPFGNGSGEIKRLYVRPAFRGTGLGRTLAERVLAEATAAGYRRVVLDTLPTMTAAASLYRSLGFVEVTPECQSSGAPDGILYFAREVEPNIRGE